VEQAKGEVWPAESERGKSYGREFIRGNGEIVVGGSRKK